MKLKPDSYVGIQGRILKLTNLDKVFYPDTGFTKRDVIRYYQRIGPTVLPHLRDRPFTLNRYPNGVFAESFYQKQCPHHRPSWVRTGRFGAIDYCLINDLPALVWSANLAAIELHTTLGRVQDPGSPTMIAVDLDPGHGVTIRECAEVGLILKKILDEQGLESFAKTSGRKGLHVYIPLNTPATYERTKAFARSLAEFLERRHPDRVTSRMPKRLRVGKVFLDWSQNIDFKTTTTVYSLRANDTPTVSTPITWREVAAAMKKGSEAGKLLSFDTEEVLARVKRRGDLFEPVLTMRQAVPPLIRVRRAA